jgi:hypothetical protein
MHSEQMAVSVGVTGIGVGIEVGRFRLKPDVDEALMRQTYQTMVRQYLSQQAGWVNQYLVKLSDGVFIDLAFAQSQEAAVAICASWQGQPLCDAFVAMIEPVSMEFGEVCEYTVP